MTFRKFGAGTVSGVRKWILTLFCLAVSIAGHAAMNTPEEDGAGLTATKVFADLPLEVTDMIRPSTRLDMLDYYTQLDSMRSVANALGGESRLLSVAPDYMKVQVTPVSTLEIKVLQAGKRQIVMTLYTTGDDTMARDTEVRFFDDKLRPLDTRKYLRAPVLTDFFILKESGISEDDLREKVPYAAVEYTVGPGDTPLTATLTTLSVISVEDRDLLTPIHTPTLTAPWKGKFTFK